MDFLQSWWFWPLLLSAFVALSARLYWRQCGLSLQQLWPTLFSQASVCSSAFPSFLKFMPPEKLVRQVHEDQQALREKLDRKDVIAALVLPIELSPDQKVSRDDQRLLQMVVREGEYEGKMFLTAARDYYNKECNPETAFDKMLDKFMPIWDRYWKITGRPTSETVKRVIRMCHR
jgi:hypothetical protein